MARRAADGTTKRAVLIIALGALINRIGAVNDALTEKIHRDTYLACIFHEGGHVSNVLAKRINVVERLMGIVVLGQFVPIRFQEKSGVTA